jgi:hypothetical protein
LACPRNDRETAYRPRLGHTFLEGTLTGNEGQAVQSFTPTLARKVSIRLSTSAFVSAQAG